MTSEGFIALPRSLATNPYWVDARPNYKEVFLAILMRCCYKKTNHNIQGNEIVLEAGQLCVTLRKLVEWCGKWISKNDVERALGYFSKCQFVRQELRHGKTVITITESEISKSCFQQCEIAIETELRQKRDIKEQVYKETKKNNNILPRTPEKSDSMQHNIYYQTLSRSSIQPV